MNTVFKYVKGESKWFKWNRSMERTRTKFTVNDASSQSGKCQASVSEHCLGIEEVSHVCIVVNMMNMKIRFLWKLIIKFFTAEKSSITSCTWGLRVIFTGCMWKCSSLSDILVCNIIKHFYSSGFFFFFS